MLSLPASVSTSIASTSLANRLYWFNLKVSLNTPLTAPLVEEQSITVNGSLLREIEGKLEFPWTVAIILDFKSIIGIALSTLI